MGKMNFMEVEEVEKKLGMRILDGGIITPEQDKLKIDGFVMRYTYKGEEYEGVTKIREEDRDYMSYSLGYDLAKIKAQIKMFKATLKKEQEKLKLFSDFYYNLGQCNGHDKKSFESKRLRKEIYTIIKNIALYEECIDTLKECYIILPINHVDRVDKFHAELHKKDSHND